jgi:hypothetical protein
LRPCAQHAGLLPRTVAALLLPPASRRRGITAADRARSTVERASAATAVALPLVASRSSRIKSRGRGEAWFAASRFHGGLM